MILPIASLPFPSGESETRGRVDLHLHTTASDGQFSPAEVVTRALKIGLSAIAVTDHDTTQGVDEAMRSAQGKPLHVIPGVEISALTRDSELHILGYYVSNRHTGLCSMLARIRDERLERAHKIISKLARLGLPLEWGHVRKIAGGDSVGRPHIAQAMLQKGYVSSVDEAFRLYLGRRRPAYIERYKLSPEAAIQALLDADGLPVLAHPLHAARFVPELARHGLVGVEAFYPGYTSEETAYLQDLASRFDLVTTGGSDFHGECVQPGHVLGGVDVPAETVESLNAYRERYRRRRSSTG
jgi:predicted metal-dependent phosphoesterase TrpH